ncbi:DUF4748 domain-containing protein [Lampris incognitus]|uniref:DUF4748 domain-containing protein n=1 Tax=Lampris incognitus TaxID=2546036 RepID=UPI0024B5BCFF|nr:DUF4748 domain-containing protein [Lampris incognitus]
MAAHYTKLPMSVLLKGVRLLPQRFQWTHRCQTPLVPLCLRLEASQYHFLHQSSGPTLSSTKADPHRSSESQRRPDAQKDDKKDESEEEYEGPEYIPKRKAKNPMMKVGFAWMIGLPSGVIGFILAKREVDKNRLKQLKVRQRMKRSNEGEYEGGRYRRHTEESKLDH